MPLSFMEELHFIAVFVSALLFAKIDADFLNAGYRFEDHSVRFVLRALIVASISCDDLYFFLLASSIFYLTFDYALNLMRGLPFLYVGTVAKSDRLLKTPYLQLTVKLVLFFTTLTLYICQQ